MKNQSNDLIQKKTKESQKIFGNILNSVLYYIVVTTVFKFIVADMDPQRHSLSDETNARDCDVLLAALGWSKGVVIGGNKPLEELISSYFYVFLGFFVDGFFFLQINFKNSLSFT